MRRWSLEHGMEIRCALGDGADDNRPSGSRSNGDGKRWRWEWLLVVAGQWPMDGSEYTVTNETRLIIRKARGGPGPLFGLQQPAGGISDINHYST
jgi:hypothetical protein